jgi:LysR family hydrogen peroxide-inducible transcriptional activator
MSDSVEFRHLEYLVAIEEGKNFTRAAEKVYRSQPAVSQQVRGLEEDIGFPIFERRGRREGITPTPAGELVLSWARTVLEQRREIFGIARAIYRGEVPTLRLGFSSFVNPTLLTTFRQCYSELFPKCEVVFSGGDFAIILQRLAGSTLDCAILPCPIESKTLNIIPVAQSQLVVCMRTDDPLASQTHLDVHEIAPRIRVFRDPELHPSAHAHLVHLFAEVGIPISLANSVTNPADIQWMVKERYGLALIDEALSLDIGLTTRPISGVNWIAETAFVAAKDGQHIALPFIQKFLRQEGLIVLRKRPRAVRPISTQLELLG